jgi:RNA 2',3'-cyclic 3'-phosphodiesterase
VEQIRSFIAIELPESVKSYLHQLVNGLKSLCPSSIKWVNPDNIHLTLKFLGNIDAEKTDAFIQSIRSVASEIDPFALNLSRIGVFPNLNNIQVIWIGLSGELESLMELQQRLETSMVPLGIPLEKRPFKAHITLARVSDRVSFAEKHILSDVMSKNIDINNIPLKVNSISFMKSQLTRTGAVYSRLCLVEMKSSCR